jgi:hypothetical protein
VTFSIFGALKAQFQAGRRENKAKRLFYFGLRIILPIQIHLLEIEILNIIQKSTPPTPQSREAVP